jgi:formylglycine-generating enzyme required for sulfatase activity
MACVPGGPFIRGVDDGPENARPRSIVWVQTYYMDINEVTFGDYKACQKAKSCNRAGPQYVDFSRPTQPINGINWYDADKYCRVKGKRLPREAQWEKASRGPDGETHPWGDAPATCELAIIKGVKEGRACGLKKAGKKPDTGRVWPVGSRPAYRYGLHDMAGNSYEWVADWYARSYEQCAEGCAGVDPRGPCDGAEECPGFRFKVVRGGSWYWDASRTLGYHRRAHVPNNHPFHHFGFRCAATLEDAAQLSAAPVETAAPAASGA